MANTKKVSAGCFLVMKSPSAEMRPCGDAGVPFDQLRPAFPLKLDGGLIAKTTSRRETSARRPCHNDVPSESPPTAISCWRSLARGRVGRQVRHCRVPPPASSLPARGHSAGYDESPVPTTPTRRLFRRPPTRLQGGHGAGITHLDGASRQYSRFEAAGSPFAGR